MDEPLCPSCDYPLVGLSSPRCPECGAELGADYDAHRPSRRRTPWSAAKPLPLWRGVWPVLRRPVKTLAACADPQRVAVHRTLMFASIVLASFLLIWGPLREVIMAIHVLIRDRGDTAVGEMADLLRRELPRVRMRWIVPSLWLAWAQVRWLMIFASLALVFPGEPTTLRPRIGQRLTAVLLMTPWFLLLDLLCSMTIWAAVGSCVPEPNSMFPISAVERELLAEVSWIWLIRLIVPVPLVATIFFRGVLRWRWWTALIAGVLLVPPAAALWMAWDEVFLAMNVYRIVQ